MNRPPKKFLKNLCKILGHEIGYDECTRCNKIIYLQVLLNKQCMLRGEDYVESGKTIIFKEPPALNKAILIYTINKSVSFIGDGVRKGFKIK